MASLWGRPVKEIYICWHCGQQFEKDDDYGPQVFYDGHYYHETCLDLKKSWEA